MIIVNRTRVKSSWIKLSFEIINWEYILYEHSAID